MKIDLLSITKQNKEIIKEQNEINFKKELRGLLSSIMEDRDEFYTYSELLVKRLNLKTTVCKKFNLVYSVPFGRPYRQGKYKIKLTQANIKLIQEYLDKENN